MDDRSLVKRLLEIGVRAYRQNPAAYAIPSDDSQLGDIGAATIANWLEALGRHRLVGDVQPHLSRSHAGFRFQVTEHAIQLWSDDAKLDQLLNTMFPIAAQYDVFLSYAAGDAAIADELRTNLEHKGLRCFMAEKDIPVAAEWQDSIRSALHGSKRVLVLLTPRSIHRPWVLIETGAAWALCKPLIPAISHVAATDLADPIRQHQARVIETTAQRTALVDELAGGLSQPT